MGEENNNFLKNLAKKLHKRIGGRAVPTTRIDKSEAEGVMRRAVRYDDPIGIRVAGCRAMASGRMAGATSPYPITPAPPNSAVAPQAWAPTRGSAGLRFDRSQSKSPASINRT